MARRAGFDQRVYDEDFNAIGLFVWDHDSGEIRQYEVIYRMVEDVSDALSGMLDPVYRESTIGQAEVVYMRPSITKGVASMPRSTSMS